MKRTLAILATAALSGVALAGYTVDEAELWLTSDQAGNWTTSSDAITVGTPGEAWNLTINDNRDENNYTSLTVAMTVDLSKLSTPNTNTSLVHVNVDTGATTLGMGLTTDRVVATEWNGGIPWSNNTVGSALGNEGLVTLIFSTSASGSSFSIEGQSFNDQYNAWSWNALRGSSSAPVDTLAISSTLSSALVSLAVWDTQNYQNTEYVQIYDSMATLSQSYSVPEPATATLSLLTLAGLAARRRRK